MFRGVANPYGTHRPSLCEAIARTTGPILELGMGDSSTPALHDLAEASDRSVWSYDHDASWVKRYIDLRSDRHRIECVSSWDECPIESTRWGVAFVDHAPGDRRIIDIARLAKQADVIVVHDTEDAVYGYDRIFGTFAHRLDHRADKPWTTLLSNYIDVAKWSIQGDGLIPNGPRQLRISVLVPCAGQHVMRLPELLDALRAQTRKPDEIIIAVSGCALTDVPDVNVPDVEAKVVHSVEQLSSGANRNRATACATGDVLIYQDADDLPHPQRVEIIAGLFEAYAIDHLMHSYYYLKEDEPERFSVEQAGADSTYRSKFMVEVRCRSGRVGYVTNGNVAIARTTAQLAQWPDQASAGEDQDFNRAIYTLTKRTALTSLPLITYRHNFSTYR